MRSLAVLLCVSAATSLGAQQPTPPPDSVRPESTEAANRVSRATTRDSLTQRRSGRLLAGLCGSSRAFLKRGRPRLTPTVYSDTVRFLARRLVTQIDSLIAYTSNCEQEAVATPGPTAAEVGKRMKTYDAALRDFRLAIGLPVSEDTVKTPKRQQHTH